jgi:DNA-binding FadR family transcriptional regulator
VGRRGGAPAVHGRRREIGTQQGGTMRKPVSKHALRRAMERARTEGLIAWNEPTGTVVDHVWHQLSREALEGKPRADPDRAAASRRREPVAA